MCPLSKTSKFNVNDMINYSLKLQKCSLKQIVTIFDKKCLNVEKFCLKSCQNTWIKQFINVPLSKKVKWIPLSLTISANGDKIDENLVKLRKMRIKTTEYRLQCTIFKSLITPCKKQSRKSFLIPYSTLEDLSNDTTYNFLRWLYWSAKFDSTKKTHLSI